MCLDLDLSLLLLFGVSVTGTETNGLLGMVAIDPLTI